jgi:16S rRNA (guanine966-N2)-methyltransferase
MSLIISGGIFRGRRIKAPFGLSTRPSSSKCRAALFNICQSKIEGSTFLDLYAGSGAVGLEALSRKAALAIFIESDKAAIKCIKENVSLLGVEAQVRVIFSDVFTALAKVTTPSDIIFIDPPYEYYKQEKFIERVLFRLLELKLINDRASIFFEAPEGVDLSSIERGEVPHIYLKKARKYGSSYLIELSFSKFL